MISKEFIGRLGNQMFQYAAMRAVQELNNDKETICISFDKYVEARGFKNELNNFNIHKIKQVRKIKMTCLQFILIFLVKLIEKGLSVCIKNQYEYKRYLFEKKISKILNKFGIYFIRQGYIELRKTNAKNKILIGYFESEKYFNGIRDKLLEEFTPIEPEIRENKKLYEAIRKSNSVCITIRRGDFVSDENTRKNHYICTPGYFYKAINRAKEILEDPKFFVFSDDVEWVKNNMNFPEGTLYESGKDPVWEKLRLMYSCKHFIISNSTFSWWAQYLSRNTKKVVIAPSKWRKEGYSKDIYCENWTLIEV